MNNDCNSSTPKVSIIVAIYNVRDYVEKCAKSIFEQTLQDIEMIFVDDGSTDDSVSIINRTLEDYPNRKEQLKLICHAQNSGLPQTRWDGLQAAQGEYIQFVDGDDHIDPRMAELLYSKAKAEDADMVLCNYFLQEDESLIPTDMFNAEANINSIQLREMSLHLHLPVMIWYRMMKKSIFNEHDIVWPVAGYNEDRVISQQAAFYSQKMAFVSAPLYYYRIHASSYVRMNSEAACLRKFEEYKANYKVLADFWHRNGFDKHYEDMIFRTKLDVIKYLLPLLGKPEYWKKRPKYWWKYMTTFPEVNRILLFGNKIFHPSYRERIRTLSIILGLYPIFNSNPSI